VVAADDIGPGQTPTGLGITACGMPPAKGETQMELVAEWLSDLHGTFTQQPQVADARVGVFYTAVQLSTGDAGVAFTPRDLSDTVCCPKTAAAAPPAGRLMGANAWRVAEFALAANPLKRAVGVAALNALSKAAINHHGPAQGEFREGLDALTGAQVRAEDRVVMVGAFIPFIRALKGRVASLGVVDKHPGALKPDEQALWVAPAQAEDALSRATVVIMSGSVLVEGGVDSLLGACAHARRRVMAGPTTPLWARPFFRRGIHILAGIHILNSHDLLTIVGEGGSGYFFERAATKVCMVDPSIAIDDARRSHEVIAPAACGLASGPKGDGDAGFK